jgi:DNA-binding PadR family transcriptional regulator
MTYNRAPSRDPDAMLRGMKGMQSSTPVKLSEIVILGLLSHQPLSGYEIFRFIEKKADVSRSWLKLNKTTVYSTLSRMEEEGLIRLLERVEVHNRPPKSVYAITDDGKQHLRQLLLKNAQNPPGIFVNLYLDISFYHILKSEEIVSILTHRVEELDALIELCRISSPSAEESLMNVLLESQVEIFCVIRRSLMRILQHVKERNADEFFRLDGVLEEKVLAEPDPLQKKEGTLR